MKTDYVTVIKCKRISIKKPKIVNKKTGQTRSMAWTEWIELVIKPQIDKHKQEIYYET